MITAFQIAIERAGWYIGSGWHYLLFAAALLFLILKHDDKENRKWLVGYTLLFAAVYICPLTARIIMKYCIGGFVYWRMFWILPTSVILAYVAVSVCTAGKKKTVQAVCASLLMALIIVTGKNPYVGSQAIYQKAVNMQKLPADACQISNLIAATRTEGETALAVMPEDLVGYVRQYDASIRLLYGRRSKSEKPVRKIRRQMRKEQPKIKKITVKVIPDNQTRILALEKGEIDMIFGKNMIDADAINQYTGNDKFTVSLSDPTSTRQIVLNTTRDVLADKEVRHALQHATNKQAISDGIFYGLEQPADTLFAKTVPYCDIDLEPYAYDVELAQSMLDEAGWVVGADKIREKDGQKLNIDLLYNSDSVTEKAIAEYLQSEYQKIGISLNIHGEEEQSYRDNMKAGNFDMVFNICWGTPYDPQSSLAAMRAPVYGDYAAQLGLEDKADIDQAITDILVSTDETKRQELYTFVLTRLHEDAVYIPLTYECNKAIYRSDLQGFHFTQTQYEVPFADFYFE